MPAKDKRERVASLSPLSTGARAADLLAWYDRHRRVLPWRALPGERADPYRVWLSEIMLQQTTVAAVAPYFARFLEAFPTVRHLADAPSDEVMRLWAGLGYYARARNLHACAKAVVARGGRFPETEAGLRDLPGIGPYTAAAIAAIAFNRPAAAVDGNVERVVSRLVRLAEPLPGAKSTIRAVTQAMVPTDRPGDFAQALMDLGATICTPKKPACALCPWHQQCAARQHGDMEGYPLKAEKPDRPLRRGAAFWAVCDGHVLLGRRPPKGLLGGMTEVPGTEWRVDFDLSTALDAAPVSAGWRRLPGVARHGFTHFELEVTVFRADLSQMPQAPPGLHWHPLDRLPEAGLPTIMHKIAALASSS
jgi:A/G-specific adenine glycosylase